MYKKVIRMITKIVDYLLDEFFDTATRILFYSAGHRFFKKEYCIIGNLEYTCKKCNYELYDLLHFDDVLTCNECIIKKALE